MSAALTGIRVLDLSRVLAGPWAGQLLGDLGAEVIKVERPGGGDDTRAWGPPYLKDSAGLDTGEAAYYLAANRNKNSIAIDITQPEGQRLVRELVKVSDVVIENFKVGGLKQYGLDYDSLRQVNPSVIYCSITGFGQNGPYATRPGYDFLIQGMGGLMSITGRKDGEVGAGPQKVGVALTDIMTGLYATVAILAALVHRTQTGEGQCIDLALLDVQVACLANQNLNYLTTGVAPKRMGNAHPNIVPYQDFPTADGDIIIAVGNDSQFRNLCRALGHIDWGFDPHFSTNASRVANRELLVPLIRGETIRLTTAEWIIALEEAGVPCGPINDLRDVFADPQVIARGMNIELPHPVAGKAPGVANPIRFSVSPVAYKSAPPMLGQHTEQILSQVLDMSAHEIADLRAAGII